MAPTNELLSENFSQHKQGEYEDREEPAYDKHRTRNSNNSDCWTDSIETLTMLAQERGDNI